jgi:WD40 repeat protein
VRAPTRMSQPLREDTNNIQSAGLTSITFSTDGKYIVSGASDQTVRIWDAQTGKQIGGLLEGHTNTVLTVAFSPDGKSIVSGSSDRTVRIWDTQTGRQVGDPLQGHTGGVRSAAFSPDGKSIVSGSSDETVRIWDTQTDEQMGGPPGSFREPITNTHGHRASILSVAFSPIGKLVVSGSADKTIRIWNVDHVRIVSLGGAGARNLQYLRALPLQPAPSIEYTTYQHPILSPPYSQK